MLGTEIYYCHHDKRSHYTQSHDSRHVYGVMICMKCQSCCDGDGFDVNGIITRWLPR